MHKSDFRKLLSFYLDCLEEEDLRSLTFSVTEINNSFFLGENGSFLSATKETQFPLSDSYFWNRHESNDDEPEKLILGYPIAVQNKTVSPVFFLEVNVKAGQDNLCNLTVASTSFCLNHHLFGKESAAIEGLLNLQNEHESGLARIDETLASVLKHLGAHLNEDDLLDNRSLINYDGSERRLTKNFILFRGGRSAVNAMLRGDIFTFLKYPKFIDNIEGTALESLLKQDLPSELSLDSKPKFFTLNDDQQKAVSAGLSQNLTVITGPPGTGKSQVVANIIATCALNKKSVLFASKNNKSVDVVYEKLRLVLGEKSWMLRLGSREKIDECLERIIAQLGTADEDSSIKIQTNEGLLEAEQKLLDIAQKRQQIEQQQNLLSACEIKIRILESKLDSSWLNGIDKISWTKNDDEVKDYINKRQRQLSALLRRRRPWFLLTVIAYFAPARFKKYYSSFIEVTASRYIEDAGDITSSMRQNNSILYLHDTLEKLSNLMEIKYLFFERDRAEKSLAKLPSALHLKEQENEQKEQQITFYQRKLRCSWDARIQESRPSLFALCRRFFSGIKNPPNNRQGWAKFSGDFIRLLDDFYVWMVTSLSARKSIPLEPKVFDVLVIDEASQCDILSALPLLFRAKRAIIIGDNNQLKNITTINAKKENEIAKKHGVQSLLTDWSFRKKSIYDVAESVLLDSGKQPNLLRSHYRCHPDIIGFSNSALYSNQLSTQTDVYRLQKKFRDIELGVFWHNVEGCVPNSPTSAYNQGEIDHIINLIDSWRTSLETRQISIGVVTPFTKQVEKLKEAISSKKGIWGESLISTIVVGTAHRFQGDECDLIFFSPVIAPGMKSHLSKWVASTEELINVAITRARGALHVVGHETSCREAGYLLEELTVYIQNCRRGNRTQFLYESPAEEIVGEILSSLELSFHTQVEKSPYRLDFIVTTIFGSRINIEVDGRQHYTSEHILKDEIRDRFISDLGYKVIRVSVKDVFTRREALIKRFSQLV